MAEEVTHRDLAAVSWPLIESTSPDEGTVCTLISDTGSQFLYYTAALLWNSLPANLRDINSIAAFQRGLKTFLFR